jgi:hypothetical protein
VFDRNRSRVPVVRIAAYIRVSTAHKADQYRDRDSNAAWKAAFHIIKAVGMNIEVSFGWDNKDKAAHPGKSARMIHEAV